MPGDWKLRSVASLSPYRPRAFPLSPPTGLGALSLGENGLKRDTGSIAVSSPASHEVQRIVAEVMGRGGREGGLLQMSHKGRFNKK